MTDSVESGQDRANFEVFVAIVEDFYLLNTIRKGFGIVDLNFSEIYRIRVERSVAFPVGF